MAFLYDTYIVVAISFVLFFAILWRYNIHTFILNALDARAERIRTELEDAKRLREEAQTLLAGFERRHKEVEGLAEEIVTRARQDAAIAAEEAKKELARSIERRLRAATDQIAAAESAAMRDVKDRAVAVATAAATDVIRASLTPDAANARIDAAIGEVASRLN
ncbi:MAG: ATP F0F1 synthase subunit B [Rhodobacterales bacterium CG_4_10_14_0_8_um_filter_70_9]|nr:MAG: ATP F0F1 synthase subunit B [Rhodobacterales bacterium CG_4_10_14_0_8_um_filter_70_9]